MSPFRRHLQMYGGLLIGALLALLMIAWVVLTTVFGTFTNGPMP